MCDSICTIFILLHPFPTFYPSHWCQPHPTTGQDLFCPSVLWFCRRKKINDKKEKYDSFACLR
jgi:hypothetical protein